MRVDHLMIVDFESFKQITDLLGGVSIQTRSGLQNFNGEQALSFVRERYGLARGDFDRMQRQQAWLRDILTEVKERNVFDNVGDLSSMVRIIGEPSAMDDGLDVDALLARALASRGAAGSGISFITAPVAGTGNEGGQPVVYLNREVLSDLSDAWRNDEVAAWLRDHPEALDRLGEEAVN